MTILFSLLSSAYFLAKWFYYKNIALIGVEVAPGALHFLT